MGSASNLFPAGHSTAWYRDGWKMDQRDVVFLVKVDGAWHVNCRISMNPPTAKNVAKGDIETLLTASKVTTSAPTKSPVTPVPTKNPVTKAPLAGNSTYAPTKAPTDTPTVKTNSPTIGGRNSGISSKSYNCILLALPLFLSFLVPY